ncbi:MAG: CoA pyrophosphatase [Sphingomonadales bacterium]|jgi:8-oxo-dGTP pyrophosphatase MutT (NUDIX family)
MNDEAKFNRSKTEVISSLEQWTPSSYRSDEDLNPEWRDLISPLKEPKPAAVLVPLVERSAHLSVLLTQRTHALSTHAGQIAFPGGRIDESDVDPIAAALRETHEEVGVAPNQVEIIGQLDEYRTGTGYVITPVVGFLDPAHSITPNPDEVADVFEVPLPFLLNPGNVETHSKEFRGIRRHFYAMPYQGYYIWGATAAMLVNLSEALKRY